MSPLGEISFTEAYRNKLQEIRDVVTGRKKIKEIHFDDTDDINQDYEKKIENLFETLQKKLLKINLSDEEIRVKIPIEQTEERKDVAATTVEVKRFYDGSNYTCNQCDKTVYGDLPFKNHIKTVHNVQTKGLTNILEFSSDHQELPYACLVCQKIVNHQFKSIYDHLKKSHSLSIADYEFQYLKPKPKPAVSNVSEDKPLKTPVVNLMKLKSSDLKKYSVSLPTVSMNSRKPDSVSSSSDSKEIPQNLATKESEAKSKSSQGNSPVSENSKKRKSPDIEEVLEPVKVVEKENESDEEIVVVYEAPVSSSPPPPVTTDPEAVRRKAKKMRTLYYCPLPDPTNPEILCTFFTVKDGFNNGAAAGHLSKIHKKKKQNMVSGLKFRKVKSEIF